MKKSISNVEMTLPTGIADIAAVIYADWHPVHYSARPYLDAMFRLADMKSTHGADSAASIITYFLGNAQTWRGETARAVKAKLNKMLKQN